MSKKVINQFLKSEWIKSALPLIDWLPNYQKTWLRTDILAGLAVWAMMVPKRLLTQESPVCRQFTDYMPCH
jgi:hypothetical protein